MPGIMGTNIYDLGFADTVGLDYADLGYVACTNASTKSVTVGNVGAGTGAAAGPFFGPTGGTEAGFGSSAAPVGPWIVRAVEVTERRGNVHDAFPRPSI